MTLNSLSVHAGRSRVRAVLDSVPAVARGNDPVGRALMERIGLALLGRIRRAFVTKARGGTDEAGDRWAPLTRATIAYSRSRHGRTKAMRGRAARPSQALTTAQQERWWLLYRQGLAIFGGNKGWAARRAWGILKSEGAKTLMDKYGDRSAETLRDTGLLLNSLSPGVNSKEGVFRVGPGEVVVGTNRRGAVFHHRGVPGRLPKRRLWPEPSRWPDSWWRDITEQAKAGLVDITVNIIRSRG